MPPSVVIGILTWRGYDATKACLESLRGISGWPIPTVVVDNASGTQEATRLATEFGAPVEALELPQNGGVPAGYNAAIQWAARRGADHVLLLNNDTVVTDPFMLDRLMAAKGEDVAAVGPIVHDPDGTVFSAGGFVSMWKGGAYHRKRPAEANRPYAADWLDGPCLLVSLRAARRVGGLAPAYFLYWEDVDWCVRAGRLGLRCLVEPRTSILHARGARQLSQETRFLILRNAILFMRRNGTIGQNATSSIWFVLVRIPRLLLGAFIRRTGPAAVLRASARAIRWNLADAGRCRGWRLPADGPPLEAPP